MAARWPRIRAAHESATVTSGAPGGCVLRAVRLCKEFPAHAGGGGRVRLFEGLELQILAGESVAILGRSGAGKSSLLHLLAGLDRPTSGEVWLGDQEMTRLTPEEGARVRNRALGFVWQFHYLLPEFTAVENVALPLLARGEARGAALAKALAWLREVGLEGRAKHRSGELSGGEQGRVALARALVTEPRVLLADEPTGDLDDETAEQMFGTLARLCRERALGVAMVTHNVELAGRCDRVLRLAEGRLVAA